MTKTEKVLVLAISFLFGYTLSLRNDIAKLQKQQTALARAGKLLAEGGLELSEAVEKLARESDAKNGRIVY